MMLQLVVLFGMLCGSGFALLAFQYAKRQPRLKSALERIGTTSIETEAAGSFQDQVGFWVQKRVPEVPGFSIPAKDLSLVGMRVNEFLYKKISGAVLLTGVGIFLSVVFVLLGLTFLAVPFMLISIPLGVLGWFLPDMELREKAAEARREFSRAVAIYLELVAAERRRGATPSAALMSSASVGRSWVFVRLRQELHQSELAGVTPWAALSQLSDEIGVPELADVAKIMRLSGESGASVYESLRQRGRGLRTQLLNDEQAKANEVSQKMMSLPIAALGGVFMGIILAPLLLNLMSFGN